MNSLRSLGSTHRGLGEWLVQRISSIYVAGFAVYLVAYFVRHPMMSYADWSTHFAGGGIRVAWGVFFLSLLLHVWVGLRSIYLDYLHAPALRLTVTALTAFTLLGMGFWATGILLRGIS